MSPPAYLVANPSPEGIFKIFQNEVFRAPTSVQLELVDAITGLPWSRLSKEAQELFFRVHQRIMQEVSPVRR